MTSLTITPNWKNKTARFKGTVAAGEHVAVTIANDDGNSSAYVASTTNLRLNVIDPATGRLLAKFPMWTQANHDDWPEGVTEADAWEDDVPLKCTIDLNTVQMLQAVPPGANVPLLFVLDDAESKTLYFKDRCDVTHWPRRVGEEEPVNLDDYKDIIKDFNDRLTDAESDIADAVTAATSAAARVATSAQSAADAAEAAGRAANAAAAAARSQADWSQNDSTKPDFIKNKPTTLAGYGIADAKIANGAITLGENTIVPLTAHQDISGKVGKSDLYDDAAAQNPKIKSALLPSYVDDVVEGYYYNAAFYEDSAHATAMTPSAGKIYVDVTSGAGGKCYRWSGSGYVEISPAPDLSPYALKRDVGIPAFSTTATYAVNDLVVHSGALYKCTTAISTAGAWDGSKWAKLFDLATAAPASGGTSLMTNGQAYSNLVLKSGDTMTGDLDVSGAIRSTEFVSAGEVHARDLAEIGRVNADTGEGCEAVFDIDEDDYLEVYIERGNGLGQPTSGRTIKFPMKSGWFALDKDLAPVFNTSTAYAVGAVVWHDGALYRCTTAVTSAGAWTGSANWTSAADLAAALTAATDAKLSGKLDKTGGTMTGDLDMDGGDVTVDGGDITVDGGDIDLSYGPSRHILMNHVGGLLEFQTTTIGPYSAATAKDMLARITFDNDEEKKSLLDFIDEKADGAAVAQEFSASVAYAVGDVVTYKGLRYRCTTAHSAAAWNASHFTAETVQAALPYSLRTVTPTVAFGIDWHEQVSNREIVRFAVPDGLDYVELLLPTMPAGKSFDFMVLLDMSNWTAPTYSSGFELGFAPGSGMDYIMGDADLPSIAAGKTYLYSFTLIGHGEDSWGVWFAKGIELKDLVS